MSHSFRVEADERRYFALRSEFLIRLVQSGLSPQTVTEIMRNFGKMESVMFFEGVRQGMVTALLMPPNDPRNADALVAHAQLYANAQTPLALLEEAVLVNEQPDLRGHPWLDAVPMEFGPTTLTEALELYGPDLQVSVPRPRPSVREAVTVPAPAVDDVPFDGDADALLAELEGLADKDIDATRPQADDEPAERPEMLDQIREILLATKTPIPNWTELILMLQRELKLDAAYLDLMMSNPMGQNVLSQCGMFHLHPGAAASVAEDGTVRTR